MVSSVSIFVLICLEKVGELYLCRKWQPSNMLHVLNANISHSGTSGN